MRFSIDAHAIGRRLTGNEVYVRNLLANFASLDQDSDFIAYLSAADVNGWVPAGVERRTVAKGPIFRLGYDLARSLRRDRPDLIHVQYTAPLGCPVPVVVSVHDVSFLVHPEYFPKLRALQLRWSVARTIPPGQTRTYGWVAERLGDPESKRAVGQALNDNPLPLQECQAPL